LWKLSFLGNADAPDDGDPDGDGIANLMEYALDLNPNVPDSAGLPQSKKVTDPNGYPPGDYLQLAFFRARSEIVYTILLTDDLQTWNVLSTNPGTAGQTVMYFYPILNPKEFLRLRVTHP
jgi:hypothetical protein